MQNFLNKSLKVFLSLNLAIRKLHYVSIQYLVDIHFLIVHVAQHFHNFAPTLDVAFYEARKCLSSILRLRD